MDLTAVKIIHLRIDFMRQFWWLNARIRVRVDYWPFRWIAITFYATHETYCRQENHGVAHADASLDGLTVIVTGGAD